MAASKNKTPDFFKDQSPDPIEVATGPGRRQKQHDDRPSSAGAPQVFTKNLSASRSVLKKKAGFYVSVDLLDRFTRKFYELKLAGVSIGNKSSLIEMALAFALDDLDKGPKSMLLRDIKT